MRGLGKVAPARDFTPPGGFAKDIRHTFYLSCPQTQLQLKSCGRSPLLLQVPGKRDVRQQRRYWQCSIRALCSVPMLWDAPLPPPRVCRRRLPSLPLPYYSPEPIWAPDGPELLFLGWGLGGEGQQHGAAPSWDHPRGSQLGESGAQGCEHPTLFLSDVFLKNSSRHLQAFPEGTQLSSPPRLYFCCCTLEVSGLPGSHLSIFLSTLTILFFLS